ncbi:ABC transporter ATP-binding protein [Actinopolymorpha pittospori]
MIEVHELSKTYGHTVAVDRLSFQVKPGRVTGFLGPNGAGKSTTMRLILGLDTPDSGTATVGGLAYASLTDPMRQVGCLLDARAVHGGRSGYHHLLWLARSNRIIRSRVVRVLELVGLADVAHRPARQFSLGMAQRLGVAAALLGDPAVLILDEPANGLDTDGIRWIRDLMRGLAREGRTVLLSSHLMSEMELAADHLIVIGQGRLLADAPMADFIEANSPSATLIRSPQAAILTQLLAQAGATVRPGEDGEWEIRGLPRAEVGDIAAAHQLTLHKLSTRRSTLEEVYLRMTETSVEFRGEQR